MRNAHEPAPPPPVGTGSLPSTAPGRRGVEPLERARVLPDPALPRYPGPLPGVVSGCFTVFPFERCLKVELRITPQSFGGVYATIFHCAKFLDHNIVWTASTPGAAGPNVPNGVTGSVRMSTGTRRVVRSWG